MTLLDTMKKVAGQTNEVNVPANFMFGTVTSLSPLTIRVDNRFDITGEAIVLMKEFRAGAYPTHTHTIGPHDHTAPQHSTQPAGEGPHSHSVTPLQTGKTDLITSVETEIHHGLAVSDNVVLFRNQGGQQFLVLGRL